MRAAVQHAIAPANGGLEHSGLGAFCIPRPDILCDHRFPPLQVNSWSLDRQALVRTFRRRLLWIKSVCRLQVAGARMPRRGWRPPLSRDGVCESPVASHCALDRWLGAVRNGSSTAGLSLGGDLEACSSISGRVQSFCDRELRAEPEPDHIPAARASWTLLTMSARGCPTRYCTSQRRTGTHGPRRVLHSTPGHLVRSSLSAVAGE